MTPHHVDDEGFKHCKNWCTRWQNFEDENQIISPNLVSLKYESMPSKTDHKTAPAFGDLPLREGDPPYSAWGLWGEDDNIGTLNWLSKEAVKDAATEIREGIRFSLK